MLMMAMLLQAAAPAAAAPAVAPWTPVEREGDNGAKALSMAAEANGGGSRLVLRCDGGAKVVSIQFLTRQMTPVLDASGNYPDKVVVLRFDALPAIEYAWEGRVSGVVLFDPEAITAIAAGLAKAKTVTVQTTNAAGFGLMATFNAPGGAAQVTQVLKACGYTLGVVPPSPPAAAPAK